MSLKFSDNRGLDLIQTPEPSEVENLKSSDAENPKEGSSNPAFLKQG